MDQLPPEAHLHDPHEDDPYQVYMLRRPAERASSVVPQLPKQPEMAETRLRYRRIPPEANSGSLGSLGNHFPPRFHFPNRRSLLESLTSDDDSSFALTPIRKLPTLKKKKKRRVRPTTDLPSLQIDRSSLAASSDDLLPIPPPPEHLHPHTPLSTSPATPVPGSPNPTLSLPDQPPVPPLNIPPGPCIAPRGRPPRPAPSPIHAEFEQRRREREKDPARARRVNSDRARHHSRRDNYNISGPKSLPRADWAKFQSDPHSVGLTTLADGRVISAPAAMNPAQRQRFVLHAELPVPYGREPTEWRRKDREKEKDKDRGAQARWRGGAKKKRREPDRTRLDRVEVGEEDGFMMRDKEYSVSFAHRRYTAEEAAAKPLNAIQKLWQVLALARMSGGRRSARRA